MNEPTITIDEHTYSLHITYADVLRVRQLCNVDLLTIADTGDFSVVNRSIEKVVNVVFVLLRQQFLDVYNDLAKAKDAFEKSLDGETLEALVKFWEEGIINFIPNLAVREAARLQLAKMTQAEALTIIQTIIDSVGLGLSANISATQESSE